MFVEPQKDFMKNLSTIIEHSRNINKLTFSASLRFQCDGLDEVLC